ncbi:hypothetical protein GOP47_0009978 [Adiantum capillus-veneris]|uniref:soluble epoxide hydrolase n=1 Tax=Adiantum capillus-veneris TaxID=13818 RepID=A0A9D4UY47_ADICA|nr:hypothetical protein GOP47_0009583 [Adiantum capillus-veneris]KAI5075902.1 hypothetical protein GOP47_0009978 [Adiantum capillus-veneris]
MESVRHRTIRTNGIDVHFAELGSGPPVVFLHGFPEGWYSWRKQMTVFAQAGYHAIAPDLRGYGDTSAPQGVENYSFLHIVGDVIGLLDALQLQKAAFVAHDWGAVIGWQLCLFRPDRVIAFAGLSAPYTPRNPAASPLQNLQSTFGEKHYILKFQVPGKVEDQIARMSPEAFFRYVFGTRLTLELNFLEGPTEKIPLPAWMTEEDLALYVSKFNKNGFTPSLNYYRALELSWELTAPWTGSQVAVPAIFMIGDQDLVNDNPGFAKFIGEGMIAFVPLLKEVTVFEGAKHFLHLEKPGEVNDHILRFFKTFEHDETTWIKGRNRL